MLAIWKREFRSLFHNVIGWLFLGVILFLYGLYFFVYNLSYGYPYVSYTLSAISFMMVIAVPILTMRVLSEERHSKTDQLLLTSPVSVGKIVLGKFLALASVFTIAIAVICLSPLVLMSFGDIPVLETYVGIFGFWLYGLVCIAIGTFVSSLTESQVVSAVITFVMLFLGYMMSSLTGIISSTGNLLTKILGCYDLMTPLEDFLGGSFSLENTVYDVSLMVLFLFLTVQVIQKRRWSVSAAKISMSVFSVGAIALVMAGVIGVNYVMTILPESVTAFDVTQQKLYSITEDTKEYLTSLDQDVDIYVLAKEDEADDMVKKMLKRYEDGSDHISVTYIDPDVSPDFASAYTSASVSDNSVIVVSGERSKVIDYDNIYEYEVNYSTYSYEATGYDGEGQITSALQYVTKEDMPVFYELTGHNETTVTGDFLDVLQKSNISLESLDLLQNNSVPKDCQALIIHGAQTDLSSDDLNKILSYVQSGGSLLLTLDYASYGDMPNYQKLLAEYGISSPGGLVADLDSRYYYNNPFYLLPYVESTDVTSSITGNSSVFAPYMAGLLVDDAYEYTALLTTSEDAVAKVNYASATTYEAEEGDVSGSFLGGLSMDAEGGGQIYVFGSCMMFSDSANEIVSGRNALLFSGVVRSLVADEEVSDAVVIPVKDYSVSYLTVSANAVLIYGIFMGLFLPIVLVIIGIIIWARRRRR